MRHFMLGLMLAVLAACGSMGTDPAVKCPDEDRQLTRAEWRACNGDQTEDEE